MDPFLSPFECYNSVEGTLQHIDVLADELVLYWRRELTGLQAHGLTKLQARSTYIYIYIYSTYIYMYVCTDVQTVCTIPKESEPWLTPMSNL